jgi:hypothetical protein
MIENLSSSNDKVLAFRVEGKITTKDIEEIYALIKAKVAYEQPMYIYMEMKEFPGMTFQSVWEEIKQLVPDFTSIIKHIEKVALVTDQQWIQKLADAASFVLSNVEQKSFTFNEREEAQKWVGM